MAMINIGENNAADVHYRYKMPRLVARIEGRGNGIKTNVVNNVDIAKALERPPEYVLKFFGCELGAQTKYDKKTGTCIVNGAHEAGRLSEVLEGFIRKYVQCYSCGNPETVVKVKRDSISLKCKACGAVSKVDPQLRLNTFIIKNPPDNKLTKAEKKVKSDQKKAMAGLEEGKEEKKSKDKKSSKKKKGEGEAEGEGDSPGTDAKAGSGGDEEEDEEEGSDAGSDDDAVWMTDTSAAAIAARAAEQLSSGIADLVTVGNVEAEAEEAAKREAARLKKEEEAAAAAAAAAAARAAEEELARLALEAVDPAVREVRGLVAGGASPAKVAAALKDADIKGGPASRMRVLYEALFGDAPEGEKLALRVAANRALLRAHAGDAQGQLAQLVALEHLLGVTLPGRVREAPLVLKALYDEDVAEEGLILAWYSKPGAAAVLEVPAPAAAAVRAAAKPFAEWLEEEEEESSEEE